MNVHTDQNDDVIDLGAITAETKGFGSKGVLDEITGQRQYNAGLTAD